MRTLSAIALLLVGYAVSAQNIREQDISYRKSVVKEINLRHPMNAKVFGKDALFSRILLEATLSGQLPAWVPDSLHQPIRANQLTARFSYQNDSGAVEQYQWEELYIIEITEDLVFDKNRSEFRMVPQRLTLFVPASVSHRGIMEPVASWKYEDCIQIWKNDARAVCPARSFHGPVYHYDQLFILGNYRAEIVKIGNQRDLYFDQMYTDPHQVMMARQQAENSLLEIMYAAFHPK